MTAQPERDLEYIWILQYDAHSDELGGFEFRRLENISAHLEPHTDQDAQSISLQSPQRLFVIAEQLASVSLDEGERDAKKQANWIDDLIADVRKRGDVTPTTLRSMVAVETFCKRVWDDELDVLNEIEDCLQGIDLLLGEDERVRECVQFWRNSIGGWRAYLHSREEFAVQLWQMMEQTEKHLHNGSPDLRDYGGSRAINVVRKDFDQSQTKRRAVFEHCESTFTALMGTLSIMESEKAITQAEEVTKLTQLAFFFIPLTFIAGIFGMNLVVSSHHALFPNK